jgi:8-oxo-dGTP diphosphatase
MCANLLRLVADPSENFGRYTLCLRKLTKVRPMPAMSRRIPVREVAGVAIVDDLGRPTRLLAARRTEPPALAGGWEFPGGKVDPGETTVVAVHREVREELGVSVELGEQLRGPLERGRWPLGDAYAMTLWWAVVTDGEPAPIEDHDQLRWLGPDELYAVPWLPADLPIVDLIAGRLGAPHR